MKRACGLGFYLWSQYLIEDPSQPERGRLSERSNPDVVPEEGKNTHTAMNKTRWPKMSGAWYMGAKTWPNDEQELTMNADPVQKLDAQCGDICRSVCTKGEVEM